MKALILAADGFEDMELMVPLYRLREIGAEVAVAAEKPCHVTGKHGYTTEADTTFDDVSADQFDLLIIPGGKAPESVRLSETAVAITRQMIESGKPVGSVCHGAQVLISAGVLKGRKATCWKGIRDDVKVAGADYSDQEVVVDGNLVTSRCPDDLPAFCAAILELAGAGSAT